MGKNYAQNRLGMILVGVLLFAVLFWVEPYFTIVFLPTFLTALVVSSATRTERDEYYKARIGILIAVLVAGFLSMGFYVTTNSWFENSALYENTLLVVLILCVLGSAGLVWMSKRVVPVSFMKDDPRIVQETMYEDGNYDISLGRTFAYRGSKFQDLATGRILKRNELKYAKGELKPLELESDDVETEAINDKGELKPFYQSAVNALFNDMVLHGGKNQAKLERLYGYSFTVRKDVVSESDFEIALKETSLFYAKIYEFLKKDCNNPDVNIKFKFEPMYIDSMQCLELTLMLMIHMLRQYTNFPVGDMAKYIKTSKDKNFLGCFSSMPSEFFNTGSTSIAPPGIAYYFTYYSLHEERFKNTKAVIKRYIANP